MKQLTEKDRKNPKATALSGSSSTLQCAQAAIVLIAREHAVLAAHDACHQVAVGVVVGHALLIYHGLRLCCHVVPNAVERVFYACYLFQCDWCSCIPFHAADAFACVKVAAEVLCDDVRRDQYVVDVQYHSYLREYSMVFTTRMFLI